MTAIWITSAIAYRDISDITVKPIVSFHINHRRNQSLTMAFANNFINIEYTSRYRFHRVRGVLLTLVVIAWIQVPRYNNGYRVDAIHGKLGINHANANCIKLQNLMQMYGVWCGRLRFGTGSQNIHLINSFSNIFSTDLHPCASDPCLNGAQCTAISSYYTCRCPSGYYGINCELDSSKCWNVSQ